MTISSRHREPSPISTPKWPGRNRAQITRNMSCFTMSLCNMGINLFGNHLPQMVTSHKSHAYSLLLLLGLLLLLHLQLLLLPVLLQSPPLLLLLQDHITQIPGLLCYCCCCGLLPLLHLQLLLLSILLQSPPLLLLLPL